MTRETILTLAILLAVFAAPAHAIPGSTQNPDGSWTGPNGEEIPDSQYEGPRNPQREVTRKEGDRPAVRSFVKDCGKPEDRTITMRKPFKGEDAGSYADRKASAIAECKERWGK